MPTWRVGGFVIRQYLSREHPPPHVHVFKDRRLVGRFRTDTGQWMEEPSHAADQATQAAQRWLEEQRAQGR